MYFSYEHHKSLVEFKKKKTSEKSKRTRNRFDAVFQIYTQCFVYLTLFSLVHPSLYAYRHNAIAVVVDAVLLYSKRDILYTLKWTRYSRVNAKEISML